LRRSRLRAVAVVARIVVAAAQHDRRDDAEDRHEAQHPEQPEAARPLLVLLGGEVEVVARLA
jgi:hypothetical protein